MDAPHQLAIIADDLTGASDTGAAFARQGLRTLVWLSPSTGDDLPPADVLVVSTESRHLPRDQARDAVSSCARRVERWFAGQESRWIYKKIDSTLRGHPAAELAALMQALRIDRALVAPAFPAQGRTTVGGRQLVNGAPLEETVFRREAACSDLSVLFSSCADLSPVRVIELAEVRRGPECVAGVIAAAGSAVWVGDAETEADLRILAQAAERSRIQLLCGSAGLARAMTLEAGQDSAQRRAHLRMPAPSGPILAMAGSRNPATARQVDAAERAGIAVLRPPPAFVQEQSNDALTGAIERAAPILSSGQPLILTISGLPESVWGAGFVAQRLASVAVSLLDRAPVAGMVLTGGDVASAACGALGTTMLWLTGEVQPGIAVGSLIGGARPGLRVATKAGGFGGEDALVAAIGYLSAELKAG